MAPTTTSTIQIPAPAKFDLASYACRYSAWKRWATGFRRFALAAGLKPLDPAEQRSHVLIHAGEQLAEIYDAHIQSAVQATDGYEAVLNAVESHFKSQLNTAQARFEFLNEKQGARELDPYMLHLRDKVKECDFCGKCADSLVATTFINGVEDRKLRKHLIAIKEPCSPNEMLLKAKAFAATKKIESQISMAAPSREQAPTSTATVDQISSRRQPSREHRQPREQQAHSSRKSPICKDGCFSHPGGKCRAPSVKCLKCQRRGHFANVCRAVNALTEDSSDAEAVDDLQLDSLRIHVLAGIRRTNDDPNAWWSRLLVGDPPHRVNFKLDTGAECSVLPRQGFHSLRTRPPLRAPTKRVVSYSDHALQIDGVCELSIRASQNAQSHTVRFYVANTAAPPILGLQACKNLQLIKRCTVDAISTDQPDATTTRSRIMAEFADIFDTSSIGCLDAVQSITIPNPPPPKKFPPRRIPMRFREQVKEQLEKMVGLGVLERSTRATTYALPVVTVIKADGTIRLCIDPRWINPHILRMKFPLPKAEQIFANLGGASFFTVVDAASAFYQLPLDEPSSDLCTISTQFGNFRFKRLPFGIVDASERFSEVMHRLFSDLEGVINCVDDFLIYGRTRTEHDANLSQFLSRCRLVGLRLKPEKLQLASSTVRFLGHSISRDGIRILEDRVEAIKKISRPETATEVRRFLGMINYVQKYIPNAAARTAPLRLLTRADVGQFQWDSVQQEAFDDLKQAIAAAPVLRHIDPKLPLTISTDASSYGMGAVLLQEGRPIAFTSASLTPTQQRYAQLEKELLAVVFACEQFRFYILGSHVAIESDHRPLESIVKKDISILSPRVQKMLLRLLRYSFTLRYVPGKLMFIADTLSRSPTDKHFAKPEMEQAGERVLASLVVSPRRGERLKLATDNDPSTAAARDLTLQGWPNSKHSVDTAARLFWQHHGELHVVDGLLYRGQRLVIPVSERKAVLDDLHAAHQGEERMLRQARSSVFWPGISSAIRNMVENCDQCQLYQRANPREPLQPTPPPPFPWHTVAADFMHVRQGVFLVVVDYFSKDIAVKKMHSTTAQAVSRAFEEIVVQHGVPFRLISDNGPPFNSTEFHAFCGYWDIELKPVSPGHPSANGQIERTIQTVKAAIIKAERSGRSITEALLTLRTTPAKDGLSPAQLSNGRREKENGNWKIRNSEG